MTETAKGGARRLAGFMLAKGYKPEALHEYTDENRLPLYYRIRLKHPVTGEKWIRPMKYDGTSYVFGEPESLRESHYIACINCFSGLMKLCIWWKARNVWMNWKN